MKHIILALLIYPTLAYSAAKLPLKRPTITHAPKSEIVRHLGFYETLATNDKERVTFFNNFFRENKPPLQKEALQLLAPMLLALYQTDNTTILKKLQISHPWRQELLKFQPSLQRVFDVMNHNPNPHIQKSYERSINPFRVPPMPLLHTLIITHDQQPCEQYAQKLLKALEEEADVNGPHVSETPLYTAAAYQDLVASEILLNKGRARASISPDDDHAFATPLWNLCTNRIFKPEHFKLALLLINADPEANFVDSLTETSSPELIPVLIEAGANSDQENADGKTLLTAANEETLKEKLPDLIAQGLARRTQRQANIAAQLATIRQELTLINPAFKDIATIINKYVGMRFTLEAPAPLQYAGGPVIEEIDDQPATAAASTIGK